MSATHPLLRFATAVVVTVFLELPTAVNAATARSDLTGIVTSQSGQPVTNASVFIYTAGPRQGVGIVCPSCYLDCAKSAKSGSKGTFKIESLDTNLLFQVLVVAPGHAPSLINKVDPLKGPLEATLKTRFPTNAHPSQIILGRVLSVDQKPLPNAVVSILDTTIGDTTSSRPPSGTDLLAVTDETGDFSLAAPSKFDSMDLRIEARGFANRDFVAVPGANRHEFVLTRGAALAGRVMFDGRPLKGIRVIASGVDNTMGHSIGNFSIETGQDGRFLFTNLPPDRDYHLAGSIESLTKYGAVPVRTVSVKGDGSKTEVDDLMVVPGHILAGYLKLSDGSPIPEHSRLLLSRKDAWDMVQVELPPDGNFNFTNLPTEGVVINTRIKGYRLSDRNASLDLLNPFQLVGRLDGDKTNMTVLLEPGQYLPADYSSPPDEERPENLPIGGIETKRVVSNALTLAGQVLDAETKAPLSFFRITPGLQRYPHGMVEWRRNKSFDGNNGTFSLEVPLKDGAIVLMTEADGYVPALSQTLSLERRTTKIELKRGEGPHGIVLTPDGKPAGGVTVCYLGGNEQASLNDDGSVSQPHSQWSPGRSKLVTDSTGEFKFAPKIGEGMVFAEGTNGFIRHSASELATNGNLLLQPWARVRGQLVRSGKPVAGEIVDLGWSAAYSPDRPLLGLHGTRTDDDGHFGLEHVPPGELQITTRVTVPPGGGWMNQPQRKFVAKPGDDLDLGEVEKSESKVRF